jgi:hypothetical protein
MKVDQEIAKIAGIAKIAKSERQQLTAEERGSV